MLTSGGDCQSLNATMRGVAKALYKMFEDVEIIGFEDGYKGLMYADYQIMKPSDFSGILTKGGTILGFRQIVLECRMPDSYLIIAGFVAAGIALLVGVGAFLKTQDKFILYI